MYVRKVTLRCADATPVVQRTAEGGARVDRTASPFWAAPSWPGPATWSARLGGRPSRGGRTGRRVLPQLEGRRERGPVDRSNRHLPARTGLARRIPADGDVPARRVDGRLGAAPL